MPLPVECTRRNSVCRTIWSMIAAICASACAPAPSATLAALNNQAFPGAAGYGANAIGGRGGRIIQVVNLNDSGTGSLRACIDASGPRVCIFRVTGIIRFTTERPIIRNPYITIAGQTAPGGGILLTHSGGDRGLTPIVVKNTHDVIIRHVRVRMDRPGSIRGSNSGFIIENSRNVILDHVSGSWAVDENIGGYANNDNVTISWSIFAEGVPRHDKCALLSSDPTAPQHLSFTNNLCAHNGDRNPDINFPPGSCVEILNNVLYNAQSEFTEVWASYGGTPVSIIGNWYRSGPDSRGEVAAITRQVIGATGIPKIYLADNRLDGALIPQSPNVAEVLVPTPPCPLTQAVVPAAQAYADTLAGAGAFPRDAVDRRIVQEVRTRTGAIVRQAGMMPRLETGTPYADADNDGMSDLWERAVGLNPLVNDAWGDHNGDGWSNLDEFLNHAHRTVLAGQPVQ
ncbi:pectate lyase family protein [Sphingomonas sp. KC8]|uniref:pectate lyase family protein n=1 Tax=Sphingomonas sp. KC8 TaxID=1030157 RepID=UPI0002F335AF|nr:pectate lyase [Sphingomonas sp. KC8]ARS28995.1 hypothetical protein KC8_17130 [Sphingomonas sp. KC8]